MSTLFANVILLQYRTFSNKMMHVQSYFNKNKKKTLLICLMLYRAVFKRIIIHVNLVLKKKQLNLIILF